jgi:hypothetical protein
LINARKFKYCPWISVQLETEAKPLKRGCLLAGKKHKGGSEKQQNDRQRAVFLPRSAENQTV